VIQDGETETTRRITCLSATLSTRNPTVTGRGFNQSRHSLRPAISLLSHGTVRKSVENRFELYLAGIGNECHFWQVWRLRISVLSSFFGC
jgi:hypothetical protein